MSARSYDQACSVANFLDRLGGRWTLLIIWDLLVGPRRFKDLASGLPAIGPNLLTQRLKELQDLGVIEKCGEQGSHARYTLTEKGLSLEPVILAMARWGMAHLKEDYKDKLSRPDLLVVAFRAAFNPDLAKCIKEAYELRIGAVTFHALVDRGRLETGLGPARQPSFIYSTDPDTFDRIVSGELSEGKARKSGRLKITGDEKAYGRFLKLFSP